MSKYQVSALGTEALQTKEIEAESVEEAVEKYQELWDEGMVEAEDHEFDHFTVTTPSGEDVRVNVNGSGDPKTARDNEYACWQRLVEMLRSKGIEINKEDDLNACLKDWAAFVHQLKKAQGF